MRYAIYMLRNSHHSFVAMQACQFASTDETLRVWNDGVEE